MIKKNMAELQRITTESYSQIHTNGAIIILDNVRSAHNVGSIFRTADCMGIQEIYLCGITSPIHHREVQKTALGAEMSIPSLYFNTTSEAILSLKKSRLVVGIEQTKNSINLLNYTFLLDTKYAFVLGNEVDGIAEDVLDLCDIHIEIPQVGAKHSLNVTQAGSIVLWEYFKSNTI